jgi:hypothetical protein
MITPNFHKLNIPACRFCKHYTPEGRHGGNCAILQSLVGGDWQACSVSAPIFSKSSLDETLEHEFMIRASTSFVIHISD